MLLPRTCSGHRFLRGVLFVLVLAASILAATPVAFAQTEVPDAPTAVAVYSIETQKLEVRWSTSDAGSTTSFKIQWKSGNQEFDSSRQLTSDPAISIEDAQSTSAGDRYVENIIGLNDGTEYTVRVIAVNAGGDSKPSATATGTPASQPGQVRDFWENEVVNIFEGSFPWLRETWDYITSQNVTVFWRGHPGGSADVWCPRVPLESNLLKCHARSVNIGRHDSFQYSFQYMIYGITHELAHVYTLANGVTTTPEPLGVAGLYFQVLAYQASLQDFNCTPIELYADAVTMLTLGDRFPTQGTYWSRCSVTTDAAVTEQALDVVRSATAGQTPSWFGDTYDDPDGNPDLERVWRDVKAMRTNGLTGGGHRATTVFQLRDAFGGYCDNQKATESAFGSSLTRNPWKDGDCVPKAPVNAAATAVGSGNLTLSWREPLYDGGSPIEGYKVQWKSGNQEYDSSRQATITDFLDLQHAINGLTNDESHSIRVLAYNHNGDGAAAEVTAAPTATDTTVPVLLLARLDYVWVQLIWNEALDESSVPPSTAFTLNVNGRSTDPSVSIRGNVVTLTPGGVTSAVDSLTVSYTAPIGSGEMPLKDSAGNTAASFSAQTVRNDRIQVAFTSDPGPDKTYSWNGGHGKQDVIEATVTFSEPVIVGGAPELRLEIGDNTRHAKYHSGSGTTALVFRYPLMWGEMDTDGIFVRSTGSLLTGPGLVRYASTKATVPAPLRISLLTDHLVDTIPPTLELAYAMVSGNYLNLRWSEALDEDSATAWPFFKVQDTSDDTFRRVTAFSIRGSLVTLTLLSPVSATDQLTVSYYDPFGQTPESLLMQVNHKPLTDTAGNSAANPSTKTVAVVDLSYPARGAPTISGTAQVGETLTADTSGISDADGLTNPAFTYQWLSDDAAIQGANDFTYTLADNDEGKAIKVEVTFTDDEGNGSSLTSEATDAVAARPNSPATGLPTMSGTAQVAETLTAFISDIEDADGLTGATFSYQWVSSDGTTDTDIPGATSATYTLVVDDIGKTITVQVSFTDDAGNEETLTSAPTDAVAAAPVHAESAPDLEVGTPSVDDASPFAGSRFTLSVTVTNAGDGASEATWLRGYRSTDSTITTSDMEEGGQTVSALAAAGTSSFDHGLTAPSEAGTYYYGVCVDSVTNESDTTNNCSSSVQVTVSEPAPDLVVIGIATTDNIVTGGSFLIGVTVTNQGDAQSAATTLRWKQLVDGTTTEIGTAAQSALTPPQGGFKTIRLTAPSTPGTSSYWACVDSVAGESDTTNNCSGRVTVTVTNNLATGAPTITGTAQVSQTLTASTSDISDSDGLDNVSYDYQWLADDSEIDGATSSTYTIQASDNGKVIKVQVTFTDDADNDEALTSEATDAVAARPNSPATGLPTMSGTAQVAETLTAFISDIEDADGLTGATFSYQWVSSDGITDTDIPGATSATYTLVVDDIGKTITVRVNYTDDRGFDETLTSAPTDAVVPLPQPNSPATGAPTISGTAQVGETLTADITGIADADGLSGETFTYQWVSGDGTTDTDIENATGSTYKLVDADKGKSVKVRVTFTDGGGNEETLTSAPTGPVLGDGLPGAPRNLTATPGNREVTLSWDPPDDNSNAPATRYRIEWRVDGKDYDKNHWGTARSTTYTTNDQANLANGVKYFFRVRAGNGSGNSYGPYGPASGEVSATPTSGSAVDLGTPVLSDTETLHHGMVKLDWEDIEDAGWYVVQYYHLEDGEWLDLPAEGVDIAFHGSSAVVSNLHGLSWLRVGAASCDGASEWSQIEELYGTNASDWEGVPVPEVAEGDEIEPCPVVLGTPVLSDTEYLHHGMVQLDWQDIEDAGWYVVQYYHLEGGEWLDLPAAGVEIAFHGASAVVSNLHGLSWLRVGAASCDGASEWSQIEELYGTNASDWEGVPVPDVAEGDEIEPCSEDADTSDNSPATGAPTISGTAQVGETLTANTSGIADADGFTNAAFTYQWLADDVDISGATGSTYTLTDSDEGKAVKIEVSFTDDEGNNETLTSVATAAVTAAPAPNSPATGAPTISGAARVGKTLTADTSGIADEDGLANVSFTYQWLGDDADISGATNATYTLADTDEGKAIKVEVSFTDDAGNEETLTSAATDTVAAEPSEPPAKPRGLSATATHGSVTLTWDDPQDESITGYVILRRVRVNDQGGDFSELVANTGSAATTYTDNEVAASTTYTYRIKAINEAGTSERSRWVHIDTPAPPVPDQPTGLEATASHGQVVLTWDDPDDDSITGYVILRRVRVNDTGGDFSVLVADTGSAATTYTDDTVAAGTTYTYRIKAINEHGTSERSRWYHISTPAAP